MKRAVAATLLALALAGGARAATSGSITARVVPNPLTVSLTLSPASSSVGTAVTATATVRNLGPNDVASATVTLNADVNLAVAGGTTRTTGVLAPNGSSNVTWQVCPLVVADYVLVAKAKSGALGADSSGQVLTVGSGSGQCPKDASATLPAGGTLSTDREGDGATPASPVETSVTTPVAGTVSISETKATTASNAFSFLGQQVQISAPAATPSNPLVIVFRLDASILPQTSVNVFRNGVQVPDCPNDPCVAARQMLPDGDLQLTVRTSAASRWTFGSPIVTRGLVAAALTTSNRHTVAILVASDGARVAGALAFDAYRSSKPTALAVSGRTAWLAGVGADGRPWLAYVEDNGPNGRGDVFRLWIGGVEQTSDGKLSKGDVAVAR